MTLADSKALASAIDPKVRDYIDAKINEEIFPIRDDLDKLSGALLQVREADAARCNTLSARISTVHELISLSRGRVERIAKELGDIE